MDNTKKTSNSGRKTNNSQSAGMTKGPTNKPISGTTNTPRGKEITLETSTQNVFTPGTPDISEGLDIPEALSFQTAQERDQQTPIPEAAETGYPDIEDLVDIGVPFAPEDLPDRGAYKEILVEFPSCMPFSSFGETVTDTGLDRSEKIFALAGRHRQALQLGEAALRRPIYSSYDKVVSRKGRKDLFKEEMDILRELLTNLYYFNDDRTNQAGFALQKIILVNLNHRLKLRRNEAEEDLITCGEGIPSLPRWGLNGKADEFWTANDFEILGACFRREVENFLAYLAEHHDFTKTKGNRKQEQRVIVQSGIHKKAAINPPTITTIRTLQPAFVEGEPDSISAYLKKSKPRSNHPVVNMNTSVFGHPAQNSSSHALRELFGANTLKGTGKSRALGDSDKQKTTRVGPESIRESQDGENESDYSHSHKSGSQGQYIRPSGGGDPGDSDGDDSDNGGGSKGPRGGPKRVPSQGNPRNNPFTSSPEDLSASVVKPPPEPQFDTKLKLEVIPVWDGNPEGLRRWFLKINSLAKRSTIIFKQLGMLVPTRLTGSAEIWYYSQSIETRDRIEQDWSTLRAAIGEYYMNRAFLDKQKARANRASYRDAGNGKETPSEYIIRKIELLQFVYNYTDRELINEIMEGAPSYWTPIITPHLLQDLEQFQLSVKFHEDSLLKLGGGENSYTRSGTQGYSKDNSHRSPYNPFRNAHVNLVGWSKATANPQYPKDDANVSPRGTPEEKGTRPCRHCGSSKHWDKDCKHARKWEKRARTNMVATTAEEDKAQEVYNDAYYEQFSDEEDMEDSTDF